MEWMENNNFTILDYEKEITEINKPATQRFTKEMFGKEEWIRISDIKIDIEVQRELQETHVQNIIRKFDPSAFGRITVSKREDGFYYCTNGQHRLRALERMGFDYCPCIVVNLHSLKDEGQNFIKINEQSAKVSNIDKYRIGVSSEVREWLLVKEALDFCGLKVATGEGGVSCVSVIYKILNASKLETSRQRDMEAMKNSLYILKTLYGIKGITNSVLQGMFIFVRTHIMSGDTTVTETITRLAGSNYKEFVSKANSLKDSGGGKGKIASYIAYLMYVEYNRGLKRNQLPLKIHL